MRLAYIRDDERPVVKYRKPTKKEEEEAFKLHLREKWERRDKQEADIFIKALPKEKLLQLAEALINAGYGDTQKK